MAETTIFQNVQPSPNRWGIRKGRQDRQDLKIEHSPYLLQTQKAPALPYAKAVGGTSTGSYPAPLQQTTKALSRLCRCAGWSAPLLFAYSINSFSYDVAQMILVVGNRLIFPNWKSHLPEKEGNGRWQNVLMKWPTCQQWEPDSCMNWCISQTDSQTSQRVLISVLIHGIHHSVEPGREVDEAVTL